MSKTMVLLLACTLVLLAGAFGTVHSIPAYATGSTTCSSCHTSPPTLNANGKAFAASKAAGGATATTASRPAATIANTTTAPAVRPATTPRPTAVRKAATARPATVRSTGVRDDDDDHGDDDRNGSAADDDGRTTDLQNPLISDFRVLTTSTSLTTRIAGLKASDDVGVTGYIVTESASAIPQASGQGWSAAVPESYTFASAGTKTLYAWAKDAADRISVPVQATVTVTTADVVPPMMTGFAVTSASDPLGSDSPLTVSIALLDATDDTDVAGYKLTEKPAKPSAGETGWTPMPPTSYTFASAGNKTLYAWTKDSSGNVSNSMSDSVMIRASDTTKPRITNMLVPTRSTTLAVPVDAFEATDDVGVTGYALTETIAPPAADAPVWRETPPTSHTFADGGIKLLYGWTKDAVGNVSMGARRGIRITPTDRTKPVVTGFLIPLTSSSLTVEVSLFEAMDDVGIAGYILTDADYTLTEEGRPKADAPGWSTQPPASHTFSKPGRRTLRAWAKDRSGNISKPVKAVVEITAP